MTPDTGKLTAVTAKHILVRIRASGCFPLNSNLSHFLFNGFLRPFPGLTFQVKSYSRINIVPEVDFYKFAQVFYVTHDGSSINVTHQLVGNDCPGNQVVEFTWVRIVDHEFPHGNFMTLTSSVRHTRNTLRWNIANLWMIAVLHWEQVHSLGIKITLFRTSQFMPLCAPLKLVEESAKLIRALLSKLGTFIK